MLHLDLITIGDLPRGAFQELRATYVKYLLRYARIDHRPVKRTEDLVRRINPANVVMVLDPAGAQMDTVAFSKKIQNYDDMGTALTVVIGGAYGLPDDVKARADIL